MGTRRFRIRRILTTAVIWGVLFTGLPTLTADAACTATQLVPTFGRWEINQGLGYDRLARGKDVLVRLYLTLPPTSTCGLGGSQSITVTAASLKITGPSGTSAAINASNAAGLSSVTLATPPALVDSKHDPIFVVPGSVLTCAPGASPACAPTVSPVMDASGRFPEFNAFFSVEVSYNQKVSSTVTNPQKLTFTTTKFVDKESSAIRIIFQPLGDISASTTQFTDANRTAVVNAVQTLLRVLPVPAGPPGSLKPPTGTAQRTGGIRYEILPSLMDVRGITNAYRLVSGVPKFCPTQSIFVALAPSLGSALDAFNLPPQAPEDAADFIVGVYGEGISGLTADDGTGCALGMATANGKVSIARAVADIPKVGATPAKVSQTGGVMAQELMHNLGAQPSPRSTTYHSSFVQSDNSDPDGAYNLAKVLYLASDKTVMNVNTSTGPWDNDVTVLEQPDYAFARCRFGGTTNAECSTADPGGTLVGVAAMDSYVASGDTMHGVSNAYFGSAPDTKPSTNSLIRLLQLQGGVIKSDIGIPASFVTTHGDGTVQPGLFVFALQRFGGLDSAGRPLDVDETRIVKLTNLSDSRILAPVIFKAVRNPAPPAVESLTAGGNPVLAGDTLHFEKSVAPPKNPDGDIVFLADTTGSMRDSIANVRANANRVMSAILDEEPNSQFGVASYKDFNNPSTCDPTSSYVYRLEQAMTAVNNDTGSTDYGEPVKSAIASWEDSGGCDGPEAQLYAFHQIVTGSTGFRSGLPRAIAWFGDAPGHNPSCLKDGSNCVGTSATLDSAIADLQRASIRVVAVSASTGAGLDSCPSELNGTSTPGLACPGQATRIANATGGTVQANDADPQTVAQALLDGLLSATVEPEWLCDTGLTLTFDPPDPPRIVVERANGEKLATFSETVMVDPLATPGAYSCTIDFKVNGKKMLVGGKPDPAFRQVIAVGVGNRAATAKATSFNGAKAVADFIYHCPRTAYFPVATSIKPSSGLTTPNPDGSSNLTFSALIDASLVPGGDCTLTALVSDLFERSSPTALGATSSITTVTKAPVVEIYTPGDGCNFCGGPPGPPSAPALPSRQFTTKSLIFASGWGTDPDGGPLAFLWELKSSSGATVGSAVEPTATFGPLASTGVYHLTFKGTDSEGRSDMKTREVNVVDESELPPQYSFNGFFPPAKNWDKANDVNGGQAFTAKWTFRDNSGVEVTTDGILGAQLQQVDCTTRETVAPAVFDWKVGATMIRYDSKGGQWVANVNMPVNTILPVIMCYVWTLELKDGSLHPLFLRVVK